MAIRKVKNTEIPTRLVGPVKVLGAPEIADDYMIPLATYEAPLWPSVARGARVITVSGGMQVTIVDERMSRSILFEARDAAHAVSVARRLDVDVHDGVLQAVVAKTSRYAQLLACNSQIVGNLLYVRCEFFTGDAAGHNMVTLAAQAIQAFMLEQDPSLRYGAISANICCDKKNSAINGLFGRGKNVVAEALISRDVCIERLGTLPEKSLT